MKSTPHELIARTFQQEAGRVIAALYSTIRDLELVEDAVQDALVLALERWPLDGVPGNPGAWITTVARRKAIDRLRREETLSRKIATLQPLIDFEQEEEIMDGHEIPDERLKLIFTCCHPALAKEAQVALTLQVLGGLTAAEVASAFLVTQTTMAQRLVRAKRKIRDAGIPYQVPPADTIGERIDAVHTVLYLIFNAGYSAPIGNELIRHDLCAEAIRLTRVLVALLAQEPALSEDAETLGLLALMLLHDSRREARAGADGDLVLLENQDRSKWKRTQIEEGIRLVERALRMGRPGPYQIQSAIAAVHAEATTAAETDWRQIAVLYEQLLRYERTPVVELNRAVAVSFAATPAEGLSLLENIERTGALDRYAPFHLARADMFRRLGNSDQANECYQRALPFAQNEQIRRFIEERMCSAPKMALGSTIFVAEEKGC